jgi:branched-chain amino acid transport system permease protein
MRPALLGVSVVAAITLGLPLILDSGQQTTYVFFTLYVVIVVGLSLLMGFAGQISLGQAAFYGLGAYTAGWLARHGVPPLVALAAAPVGSALVASLIGVPVLRLRGHYLAFATLAFQLIVLTVLAEARPVTGGDVGLGGIPQLLPVFNQGQESELNLNQPLAFCYVGWLAAAVVILITRNLVRSRPGRGLRALATSEMAAASSGVAVPTEKLKVFAISAAYAGLAGGIYAFFLQYLTPGAFGVLLSIQFLVMATVGGLGLVWGAVTGTAAIMLLVQALAFLASQPGMPRQAPAIVSYATYGIVLVIVMLFMPGGLLPALQRLAAWAWHRGRRARSSHGFVR